jgi:hypothetical protein
MNNTSSPEKYHPWTTYIAAREEARRRGDRRVGTDHLLLGLLHDADVESIVGVSLDAARAATAALDHQALAAIGIPTDLDAPMLAPRELPSRPTVKAVMKDRLRLTPAAAAALREAGRPSRRGRDITAPSVLAALLENRSPDPAAELLTELKVDLAVVRARLAGRSAA